MTGLVLTVPEADGGDEAVRLVRMCTGSPEVPGALWLWTQSDSCGDEAHEWEVVPTALDLLRWNLSVVGHLCQQIAPQSVKHGVLLFS